MHLREHISTEVDISMHLVVNILKISTKPSKILNRRLRMKIFNQFFLELKEYISEFLNGSREEWLLRISGLIGVLSILPFIFFIWKPYEPDFVKSLSRFYQKLIRYASAIIFYLLIFHSSLFLLKFFFLRKK